MKTTCTKLLQSIPLIAGLVVVPKSYGALSDWQSRVTGAGTTPAATVFTSTSGGSPILTDVGSLSGDRTFEFIVNAGLGGASSAFLGYNGANGNQGLKFEQWQDTGVYGMTVFGLIDLSSTTSSLLNRNTHVLFVSDGSSGTDLWIDGTRVHTFSGYPLQLTGMQGLAGIATTTPGNYIDPLDGNILGFASYNSALSQVEILDHYNAFVVPEPSVIGLFGLGGLLMLGRSLKRRGR